VYEDRIFFFYCEYCQEKSGIYEDRNIIFFLKKKKKVAHYIY